MGIVSVSCSVRTTKPFSSVGGLKDLAFAAGMRLGNVVVINECVNIHCTFSPVGPILAKQNDNCRSEFRSQTVES
jgi:hypothetical protein